ncbi:GNVR domain-containing protein [Spirosoma sp. KNUC1025]|uniref:GNVR domain-containing protein n=1 Tax=Spirosoma sp. KNUC1025 TaxID=2894082 RepID=UPI0038682F02|nr:lipopolysaccharide biosynthesis protein [Spirosoma sp. KNUC1025]
MTTQAYPLMFRNLSPATVVQAVWPERSRVLITVAAFSILGIVTALLLEPEFRSEARIMPEMSNGSGDMFKRLASVAGFAGMDFAETEGLDAVRPDLYPNVLQSTPFILYLIDQPVTTTDDHPTTIGQFLAPENKGWSLKRLFSPGRDETVRHLERSKPAGPVRLSARQRDLADEISERVSAKLDTRSGIITITATMPDANVAAAVAHLAMDYLTQYVTSYRTGKARQDLQFYTQRRNEARQRFQTAQLNVFRYNDQHKYYVVQAATMDKQRLEAELSIAQTVYTELSRQFEQARLKVQERTPVFKVLEPAQVPLKRISPKRTLIVVLSAAIGLVFGVVYVLIRKTDALTSLRIITD